MCSTIGVRGRLNWANFISNFKEIFGNFFCNKWKVWQFVLVSGVIFTKIIRWPLLPQYLRPYAYALESLFIGHLECNEKLWKFYRNSKKFIFYCVMDKKFLCFENTELESRITWEIVFLLHTLCKNYFILTEREVWMVRGWGLNGRPRLAEHRASKAKKRFITLHKACL